MATELSTMTLTDLEAVIERGLSSFIEVGNALAEIRDAKMYGSQYATFDEYCEGRWGFTRQRAYQLIDASDTVAEMSTRVDIETLPATEAQVRALKKATSDPDEQAKILKKAVKNAPKDKNGKPQLTAPLIAKAAAKPKPASDPEADRAAAIMASQKPPKATREPGDESETEPQAFKNQRSKTIKTVEALMRAFDDLHGMQSHRLQHAEAIASCKVLLKMAKDWSC